MAKFPLYQWKKVGEGSSSIDTQNFASKIKANTFTQKNTFKNTGDIVSIQRTDNQSFGIDFKREDGERVAYIGTSQNETDKATVWGVEGLILQTTNKDINISPGTGHTLANSSKNWNQHVDNSIVRYKDLKFVRIFEKTTEMPNTTTAWQTNLTWPVNGINTEGLHEVCLIISINNVAYTLNTKIVWKSGLAESKSQFLTVSDGTNEFMFQLVIRNNGNFQVYHKKNGGSRNIEWIRGWIIRGTGLPWKIEQLW